MFCELFAVVVIVGLVMVFGLLFGLDCCVSVSFAFGAMGVWLGLRC